MIDLEFFDVSGFAGFYKINKSGTVISVERYVDRRGIPFKIKQKEMKPHIDRKGYYFVSLSRDGFCKHYRLHRLLAINFIPNPENLPCVNHIDMNRLNNSLDNLEWCTHLHNMSEAFRLKGHEWISKRPKVRGPRKDTSNSPRVKVAQYSLDGVIMAQFDSIKDAAITTNTNRTSISECISGRHKTGNNFIWKRI